MKKVYVTLAAAMMLAGTASAQFSVGIEGGLNINNLANKYQGETVSNQAKYGIHAGIVTDFAISNNFSISPALRYSLKGGKEDRNFNSTVNGQPAVIEQENKLSFHYLELPLNLVYRTGNPGENRFMIGAGPYVAYLLNAHNKFTRQERWLENGEPQVVDHEDSEQIPVGEDDGDYLKSTDVGAQAFLGYEFARGPFIKAGSSIGITNVVRGGSSDFYNKNYNFFLTVGYMFGR